MQTNGQTYSLKNCPLPGHSHKISEHMLNCFTKGLASVHSHQSECGWANHPAGCRCDTYEGHSAHLDEIQSAPEGYQTVA